MTSKINVVVKEGTFRTNHRSESQMAKGHQSGAGNHLVHFGGTSSKNISVNAKIPHLQRQQFIVSS
jgi:hypothetical protein